RSAGGRLDAFIDQFPVVGPDLWAVTAVAALGFLVALRSRRVLWIAPAWLLAALVALNAGGLYLPHYFIQLIPPLALLAAIGATGLPLRSPAAAVSLTCLAIAPVAVTLVQYATMPSRQRERTIVWDRRYQIDREVARFVRAHSTPRDQLMALPSRADLYFLAHRLPPIPYLWEHTPLVRASTIRTLRRRLAGPERPKFVVVVGLVVRQPGEPVRLLQVKRLALLGEQLVDGGEVLGLLLGRDRDVLTDVRLALRRRPAELGGEHRQAALAVLLHGLADPLHDRDDALDLLGEGVHGDRVPDADSALLVEAGEIRPGLPGQAADDDLRVRIDRED